MAGVALLDANDAAINICECGSSERGGYGGRLKTVAMLAPLESWVAMVLAWPDELDRSGHRRVVLGSPLENQVPETNCMTDRTAVLVVEDEALILLDIAFHLEAEGFKVYEASNADAAIRLLDRNADIRLVFTDIDMPGSMDGLKLAAAVRDRWPPVKIIVTSGRRLGQLDRIPSGSTFFSKPYVHETITQSIRNLVAA